MATSDPRIIVALDFADPASALALVDRVEPAACALKVGKELFVAAGPGFVRLLIERVGVRRHIACVEWTRQQAEGILRP